MTQVQFPLIEVREPQKSDALSFDDAVWKPAESWMAVDELEVAGERVHAMLVIGGVGLVPIFEPIDWDDPQSHIVAVLLGELLSEVAIARATR